MIDTQKLRELTKRLDIAVAHVNDLHEEARHLSLSGHQEEIMVYIGRKGARPLRLSYMERDYSQRLIRGREMIMLGAKKAYAALISEAQDEIARLKAEIASEAKG